MIPLLTVRETRIERARAERRRIAELQAAHRPPTPTGEVKRLLKELETALVMGDRAKADGDTRTRKVALGQIRLLSAQIDALWTVQTNEAWAGHALAETVRLEQGRGGTIDAPHVGPYRASARDGFQWLLEAGRLGDVDDKPGALQKRYEAGIAYREGVERRSSGLGSQLGANEGRAGHDNDKFVIANLKNAKATLRVSRLDRLVALQCRDEPACLQMLRWVVGEGHSLSAFGKGNAFDRHLKALIRALDVIADAPDDDEERGGRDDRGPTDL